MQLTFVVFFFFFCFFFFFFGQLFCVTNWFMGITGSRSSFMNTAQELSEIARNARSLAQRLGVHKNRRRRSADPWGDVREAFVSLISLSLSFSQCSPLICGVNFYVCGRFSTPSFYQFWS